MKAGVYELEVIRWEPAYVCQEYEDRTAKCGRCGKMVKHPYSLVTGSGRRGHLCAKCMGERRVREASYNNALRVLRGITQRKNAGGRHEI